MEPRLSLGSPLQRNSFILRSCYGSSMANIDKNDDLFLQSTCNLKEVLLLKYY